MNTLILENDLDMLCSEVVVMEYCPCPDREAADVACKPLWLTPAEAEALLALCMASPVSGGACEQELFGKLGAYMRSLG